MSQEISQKSTFTVFDLFRRAAPEAAANRRVAWIAPQDVSFRETDGGRIVEFAGFDFALEIRRGAAGQPVLYFPYQSISDLHLGTRQSRAKRTSQMLQHTASDRLDLVGDIIDGEHLLMKKHWNWAPWHRQVLGHILRRAENGVDVRYQPGNHDMALRGEQATHTGSAFQAAAGRLVLPGSTVKHRDMRGKTLMGVRIDEETDYTDPQGRRFRIIHGDQFDDMLFGKNKGMFYAVGSLAYDALIEVDTRFQQIPRCEHISIAAIGKRATKTIINQFLGVRRAMMKEVDSHAGVDGIIYGHSHMMEIDRTGDGKLLINDGCCTEHVQTAVHDAQGRWAVLEWHKDRLEITAENGQKRYVAWKDVGLEHFAEAPLAYEDMAVRRADTLTRLIYRQWPPRDRQRTLKNARCGNGTVVPHIPLLARSERSGRALQGNGVVNCG